MIKNYRYLGRFEKTEKKIEYTCSFSNAKYEFKQGKVINLEGYSLSIIEPHKYTIRVKDKSIIVIFFNEDNIFLYNRYFPIDMKQLKQLLSAMKEVSNYE
ncbi:MAG: hypothetical protein J6B64_00610 [Bacilli bacterium]|nr:hypothetical protein [Bacilli bacterium]MBP3635376.1 hypothetical protein [Bacilli bacterium]